MREILKSRRPRPYTLVILLIAVIARMWALRLCTHSGRGSDGFVSAGGDTLDVAIEYSPMALYRYADTLGGFSYDFLRMIASEAGIPLKFHPVTAYEAAAGRLADGDYDLLVAAIPVTTHVDTAIFAFTEPVALDRQVLVQRRDSAGVARESQLDLAGAEVWVVANSPVVNRLRNLSSEIGDTIIVHQDPAYGEEQLLIMTATGDIPCAVVGESTARALADSFPQLHVSTAVSFTQFQAWMTRRDDQVLRQRLDTLITAAKSTPAYIELRHRYAR